MTIDSTFCTHMEIYKQTRVSPNGMTSHQIDHILIERRWATNIMKIRSYRGACCVSRGDMNKRDNRVTKNLTSSVLHQNVQSISNKQTELDLVLKLRLKNTEVLCFTEH